MLPPTDSLAAHFPVSIKGVVFEDDRAILLRNERDEWELPGGKLDLDESPAEYVRLHASLGRHDLDQQ